MALINSQKAKIRRYLGYPDVNREMHLGLEGAMTAISAEGETEVTDLLTKIASVETTLVASQGRQKVIKAEEVTLAGEGEIRALWREGNRYASTLASILDVPLRRNPFGAGSSSSGVAMRGA
jgi:hypothetical protein